MLYKIFIIAIPAFIFLTLYCVLFFRSGKLSPQALAIVSRLLYGAAIISWLYAIISDIMLFIRNGGNTVEQYLSYNVWFAAVHTAAVFFIGVVHALAAPKEKDWRER